MLGNQRNASRILVGLKCFTRVHEQIKTSDQPQPEPSLVFHGPQLTLSGVCRPPALTPIL